MQDLIIILGKLAIALFLIRFHANLYRLGFNPIVSRLNRTTDPLVLPFRKLLPPSRFDFGAVIVAAIIALLVTFILFVNPVAIPLGVLLLLNTWLNTTFYAILITVIGSWLQTDPRQPVMQIALSCCEWLMAPLRRIIPPVGMLDFSPMAALFLIYLAQQGLARILFGSIAG
ncbi:YggT family protein [uncultured Cardiobacterium sp.]|uniref:YggT family protein n=1 Tax=uncultured Cardiobacterium sp. TaxID=417619 RepID=UPI0026360FB8|nr:YggT family protein [uncultured Cardiobacterium sp.]